MLRCMTLAVMCLVLQACGSDVKPVSLSGKTMGTTWSLVLVQPVGPKTIAALQASIESELIRINGLVSTWQADSDLSLFNANPSTAPVRLDPEILFILDEAIGISDLTDGAYDVTLGSVIELWGFGAAGDAADEPSETQLQKISETVGYERLIRDGNTVAKANGLLQFDLSSIAKGYAVDRIGLIVERAGFSHYLSEIGGEIRARGGRSGSEPWHLGVETPDLKVVQGIAVTDANIASSGSYRNYREVDGVRVSHLIDGRTYKPISHKTVAATVMHRNTMLADAWATALMVVGPEEAKTLVEQQGMDVQLTFKTDDGFELWRTPGFTALVTANPGGHAY